MTGGAQQFQLVHYIPILTTLFATAFPGGNPVRSCPCDGGRNSSLNERDPLTL